MHLYIYIYMAQKWGQRSDTIHSGNDTWRSGDNEVTPSIQQMTRGDAVGKCNRCNSVSETTHTTQELARGISFGRQDEHRKLIDD